MVKEQKQAYALIGERQRAKEAGMKERSPLVVAAAALVISVAATIISAATVGHIQAVSAVLVISLLVVVIARKNRRTHSEADTAQLADVVVHGVPAAVQVATVAGVLNTEEDPTTVLKFTVNGEEQALVNPSPSLLLVDYLRDTLGLTGTKIGCGEGGCGACTCVAVGADGVPRAINSCLRLLCACDGLAIMTVEGFGSQATGFSKAQKAIADGQGSQCGFCTPGWVAAMEAMLARAALPGAPPLTAEMIETSLDGNLCRCTGYRPILQAFKTAFASGDIEDIAVTDCHDVRTKRPCARECDRAVARARGRAVGKAEACERQVACEEGEAEVCCGKAAVGSKEAAEGKEATEERPCCTPPPPAARPRALRYTDSAHGLCYLKPTTLPSLISLLRANPGASIVAANTGMGVAKYYSQEGPTGSGGLPPQRSATIIDVSGVQEMAATPEVDSASLTLTVGAAVTIEVLITALDAAANAHASMRAVAETLARHLRRVATTQVRAVGTWAGNVALASKAPALPSDVVTLLAAAHASLTVIDLSTYQTRIVDIGAYTSAGCSDVIVYGVLSLKGNHAFSDKTSQRHANSHAIVNACLVAEMGDAGHVHRCTAAFGGMLAKGLFISNAATTYLVGQSMRSEDTLRTFVTKLLEEVGASPASSDPFNSAQYRSALLASYVYKFFLSVQPTLPPRLLSAVSTSLAAAADRPVSTGVQRIDVADPALAPVSLPLPKLTARLQASGEARYTSDTHALREVNGAFIDTAVACGTLEAIDVAAVRAAPGVVDVVLASDFHSEEANVATGDYVTRASDTTPYYLLPIGKQVPCAAAHVGMVLADTTAHARYAATLAKLTIRAPAAADAHASAPAEGAEGVGTAAHALPDARTMSESEFRRGVARLQGTGRASRMGMRASLLEQATAAFDEATASAKQPADTQSVDGPADAPRAAEREHHWGFLHGRHPATWLEAVSNPPSLHTCPPLLTPPLELSPSPHPGRWREAAPSEGLLLLDGTFTAGQQKHFFLETHATIAVPGEDGKLVVTSAMQAPTLTQASIAHALDLPAHKVDVRCRRVGGAYGGKLSNHAPTAVVASLAAVKSGRPVRVHNERVADMVSTGGRASLQSTWSAAVDRATGVISSVALHLTFDSGCTDGATGDLSMALQWSDNCYRHADFSAKGAIQVTPRPGNTSARAPGVLVSVPLHEVVLEAVAERLGMPVDSVRETNMYLEGDVTPAVCGGVTLGSNGFNWTVPSIWQSSKAKWKVEDRRGAQVRISFYSASLKTFNASNRWRKRGLSLLPIKYGIDATFYHMSSAVRILGVDGSVQVVHGGCELGQGIHTKVGQAVAYALGCPLGSVTIGDTSTLEAPNSNATGGSGGSESCVRSALDACAQLNKVLKPFRKSTWQETVKAAWTASSCLHAVGWESVTQAEQPKPFDYATQGVGCVEVEVDALTGEIAILRADICMDQGTPLNPLIDMGQVEGGFMMALGYYLTEEVRWSDDGSQLSLGTWQYKPPAVADIPIELNIEFVAKTPNPSPNAVLGSKASAEPPMALGAAAFFAARHAIREMREQAGCTEPFEPIAPLTVERIQQACLVTTEQFTLR